MLRIPAAAGYWDSTLHNANSIREKLGFSGHVADFGALRASILNFIARVRKIALKLIKRGAACNFHEFLRTLWLLGLRVNILFLVFL